MLEEGQKIFLTGQKDFNIEEPGIGDVFRVGNNCRCEAGGEAARRTFCVSWLQERGERD